MCLDLVSYAAPRTQQIIYLEQLNKYEAQQGNDQCVKIRGPDKTARGELLILDAISENK